MLRLIGLIVLQSVCLCGGQVFLKIALKEAGVFSWTGQFFIRQLTNWWFLFCGISFISAAVLWMYLLKHFPFSKVYPLSSITFLIGMCVAVWYFHEPVAWTGWVGVLLIMAGCAFIVQ